MCPTRTGRSLQVHKAHDHVGVVEEGAVLRAGQWGRAAAARCRGQEALARQRVCGCGRRRPGPGRAGLSMGPGVPRVPLQRPVLVVIGGQGVVQIQHEEGCGLQPPRRGLPAGRLLLRERGGLRLLQAVQGPRSVREPQHRQNLLLHLSLLVRLEPPVEEARGRGRRWQRLLLGARGAPAVPRQLRPGGGGGGQGRAKRRGPAAAAQQPPPPTQPLRPAPQPRHPRPAGLPRGLCEASSGGARPRWPWAWTAPATSRRACFPFLALSPYLAWSSGAPPVSPVWRGAVGAIRRSLHSALVRARCVHVGVRRAGHGAVTRALLPAHVCDPAPRRRLAARDPGGGAVGPQQRGCEPGILPAHAPPRPAGPP